MTGLFGDSSDPSARLRSEAPDESRIWAPDEFDPLSPMPAVGADQAAAWLRRLAAGAYATLAILPLSLGGAVAEWLLGIAHPAVAFGIEPILAAAAAVCAWLLTCGEPHNLAWLRLRRWMVRIGALLGLAHWYLVLSVGGALPHIAGMDPYHLAGAVLAANLGGALCALVALWYSRELARRLGDVTLRKNLTVVLWVVTVLAVFGALSLGSHWQAAVSGTVRKLQAAFTRPHVAPAPLDLGVSAGFLACLFGYFGWLLWRLGRGLREAAASGAADEAGTDAQSWTSEEPS
ncbi:MAG: hypothetical protein ACOC8F_02730 [Planctomycetota bacterium]